MKKALTGEQYALSAYLDTLLGDGLSHRMDAMKQPFECHAFQVYGMALAVPCAGTNGIVPDASSRWRASRNATGSRFHDRPESVGVFHYRGHDVMAVSIARMLIPPSVFTELADPPDGPLSVILVDDERLGIICDSAPSVITVAPDEVCWSTASSPRPWLAGMISRRRALLDVRAICAGCVPAPRVVSANRPGDPRRHARRK
jgi:hypothetical protein